jgi:hypothetical protein
MACVGESSMSKQQNFFIDLGEAFTTDISVTDEDGPIDLAGHVFSLKTPTRTVGGVVNGNNVSFTLEGLDEDTKYVIDHVAADGTYDWVLFGEVKVREWLPTGETS